MHLFQIVNRDSPLDSTYIPSQLAWDPVTRVWLVKEVYEAFYLLTRQMQEEGMVAPVLRDGYRSYAYQKKLYETYLKELGYRRFATLRQTLLAKEVVQAGHSEHQLGTSIDLVMNAQQHQWIYQQAQDFGFVVRYPKDKVHLTGRLYEADHYRYVGVGHAKKMKKMGLCLEEYNRLYSNR